MGRFDASDREHTMSPRMATITLKGVRHDTSSFLHKKRTKRRHKQRPDSTKHSAEGSIFAGRRPVMACEYYNVK